jgi:hypothetical protein
MATAQQQSAFFSPEEAQRFAALWAGFDTGNPSEPEAMAKGRGLRRMLVDKNIRLVDALELPGIRKALDAQMQPVRQPVPDVAALRAENDDLRRKLAVAVPKVREFAAILKKERNGQAVLWGTLVVLNIDADIAGYLARAGWPMVVALICVVTAFYAVDVNWKGVMSYMETIKEKALLCYTWASYVFFGLGVLSYLARLPRCGRAGRPHSLYRISLSLLSVEGDPWMNELIFRASRKPRV